LAEREPVRIASGVDPIKFKQDRNWGAAHVLAPSITFKEACARYIASHRRLEKRQARRSMGGHTRNLRLRPHWRFACKSNWHSRGDVCSRTRV